MANFDELAMLATIEAVEEAEIAAEGIRKQSHLRSDSFQLSEKKFIRLFRLPKYLALEVIEMIRPFMQAPCRTSGLDITTKFLVALRFFASGSYQMDIGCNIYMSVSQSSVSRAIKEVVDALNKSAIFNQWIYFPRNLRELEIIRNQFYQSFQFPGVVGLIDCTHIAIFPPNAEVENIYVNRKNYHSINVQLVCDWRLKILNINARYPGSTNDAYVWRNSNLQSLLKTLHENGQNNFYLLGDSGYPLRPWLLTPLENDPEPNTPEEKYNRCHKVTRSAIERCNGVLKMRFRCLLKHRVLHYTPDYASKIINACAVLHNICITNNVPEPDDEEGDDSVDFGHFDVGDNEDTATTARRVDPDLADARRLQRLLIRNYFTD